MSAELSVLLIYNTYYFDTYCCAISSLLDRIRQPYDQWAIKYEMPEQVTIDSEYEEKLRNYESDSYVHEEDFEPGLEGFLHNVKRLAEISGLFHNSYSLLWA